MASQSTVAPLFIHGQGSGTFGCMAINPPVFLTEDEAREVIELEAQKAGLSFVRGGHTIRNARLPEVDHYFCGSSNNKPGPEKITTGDLQLDGFDAKRNVAYEFVSGDDLDAWETKQRTCFSTVSVSDAKGAAARLRQLLPQDSGSPRFAVFYEPAASRWTGGGTPAKTESKEELRKQVRDFIQWLKAQGVI